MNFHLGRINVAHLVGLDRRAKKSGNEDEMGEDANRCDDDEEAESHEPEEEASDKKGGEKKKSKKKSKSKDREDGDGDTDDEDDNDDDRDDEDDENDDGVDDDEDNNSKKAEARGRKAERGRCAEIITSEAASKNIALAAELAFGTNLSAEKAISVLKKGGSAGGLRDRMAERKQPHIGSGDGKPGTGKDAIASSWERAAAPFMPKK